jgi:hypothetical protein
VFLHQGGDLLPHFLDGGILGCFLFGLENQAGEFQRGDGVESADVGEGRLASGPGEQCSQAGTEGRRQVALFLADQAQLHGATYG